MATADTGIARKVTRFLPDGTYAFEDELCLRGVVTATFVTCHGWLMEYIEIEAGSLSFQCGGKTVFAPGPKSWVFYPPFSLCRPSLRNLRGKVQGRAGLGPITNQPLNGPIVFQSDASISDTVPQILSAAKEVQTVDLNPQASALSIRARQVMAQGYSTRLCMADIAAALGVSSAHLSRQFRRDYGMTPTQYLHQLRLADVPLQLARGAAIADVSLDAGYGDLSRFYKHFRKSTKSSPGRCRKIMTSVRQ